MFIFPHTLFIPMVFLAQCEPTITTLCNWAGASHFLCVRCFSLFLSEHQNNNAFDCTCNWVVLSLLLSSHFPGTWVCFPCAVTNVRVCLDICGCVSVSAENLEKSLRQMERQLLQLERDLETFNSPDDPNDMFLTKMAISFTHAHIRSLVWGVIQRLERMLLEVELVCLHLTLRCCIGWQRSKFL